MWLILYYSVVYRHWTIITMQGHDKTTRLLRVVLWKAHMSALLHVFAWIKLFGHRSMCTWFTMNNFLTLLQVLVVMGMVFSATVNNISAISWLSVLLVWKTGIPVENHQPVASHWQAFSHNVLSSTSRLGGIRTHNVGGDSHWLQRYSSYKSDYHTIMTTTTLCMKLN